MLKGIVNRLKFILERLLLGGAHFQLLIMAGLILLVSLCAGFLAYMFAGSFDSLFDASWWAFLRLSDPGYLGDDQGAFLRAVSVVVTILGYVLFMGALIAIMTQWLNATIRRFESGLTPISLKNHILILGWTNRTKTIVKEIIASQERLGRFLVRIGAGKLRIVILSESVDASLIQELREELGGFWKQRQIILRSGTPLRIEDLKRVNFGKAGVIILPGSDFSPGLAPIMDTRTVKSLLSISKFSRTEGNQVLPPVVAELFDVQKIPVAKSACPGKISLIPSDSLISRLLAQNVRHQGLSFIYAELLSHNEGNQIYIRELPQLAGRRLEELHPLFPDAVLMGLLRTSQESLLPFLNPPGNFITEEGDRFVFLAGNFEGTLPAPERTSRPLERHRSIGMEPARAGRKILILGWNRKVPILLYEFESYQSEQFDIDLFSMFPVQEREDQLKRFGKNFERVRINHIHGDYTALKDLLDLHPAGYDNILLLSNDRFDSGEESDARTIFGYVLLRDILSHASEQPGIIIELMDPENDKLFEKRTGEVLISPLILSHILAHVALRPELNVVFEELFTTGGAELFFRPASEYGISPGSYRFEDIRSIVTRGGDTALGIRKNDRRLNTQGGIELNPAGITEIQIDENDEIVVLTTYR